MKTIGFQKLITIVDELLKRVGASDEEAAIVSESLVNANLAGVDSHGIIRIIEYIDSVNEGKIVLGSRMKKVYETPTTCRINGNWGFGQLVATKAVDLAVEKAHNHYLGSVSVFNCNHVGRLAEYTIRAAKKEMICLLTVNSDPTAAAFGGRKPILGTNPLSYSIPTGCGNPIVVDFATSVVSEGKVRNYFLKGEKIPQGWIVDSKGHPSTNPADLYDPPLPPEDVKIGGALLTFAGHKGYGLSLIIDVLSGALSGLGCNGDVREDANGLFITAVNPEGFISKDEFYNRVTKLIRNIKSSPKAAGVKEIFIPGEIEFREIEIRKRNGIPIPDEVWDKIMELYKS